MDRREFFRNTGVAGAFAMTACSAPTNAPSSGAAAETARRLSLSQDDRGFWIDVLRRLADPVLTNLADGTLKARMPVEQNAGAGQETVTHLQAVGRVVAGIAPWLELPADSTAEGRLRAEYADLTRRAIGRAVDPSSPDFLNFTRDDQPLADAAYLAQGLLRAPRALREAVDPATKRQLVAALESTRGIVPSYNNWLLFSATVEAGLARLGASWDWQRVDYALRQHDAWYKGDGVYGDGPQFHWDYYNSFVIHPMLLDVLDAVGGEAPAWNELANRVKLRARRYAGVQERLIAPDGTFPAIGRSIAYRFGAFHLLAQMALRRELPDGVEPAQVRGALTAVIRRTIEPPNTFDADGWLRIGLCGHQPEIAEPYISTGSLYLCALGLLPLGLPPTDPFWSAPSQPWTSARAWSGQPFPIDWAIKG